MLVMAAGNNPVAANSAFGLFCIYSLTLPFFCLRPDIIALDRPPRCWWPRWPGSVAVALLLAYVSGKLILEAGIAIFAGLLYMSPLIRLFLWMLSWLIGFFLLMPFLIAWQRLSRWRDFPSEIRIHWSADRLRRVIAADLWLNTTVLMLLAPPLIISSVFSIHVLPQTEDMLRYQTLPLPLQTTISISRQVVSDWWWFGVPLLFWFSKVAQARALELDT